MSMLNLMTLNELKEMLEEGLDELLDEYLLDTPSQLEQLKVAVEAGDITAIASVAHTLKGSSGNLGVSGVSELCQQLEQEARGGAVTNGSGALEAIAAAFEQAKSELAEYRAG